MLARLLFKYILVRVVAFTYTHTCKISHVTSCRFALPVTLSILSLQIAIADYHFDSGSDQNTISIVSFTRNFTRCKLVLPLPCENSQLVGFQFHRQLLSYFKSTQTAGCFVIQLTSDLLKSGVNNLVKDGGSLLLIGPPGVGKTTVIR